VLIESTGGPERAEFNRLRRDEGLKAALAWRDARFAQG
jgi:enoyl-CoA hydratase